jgi:hypothetical protein
MAMPPSGRVLDVRVAPTHAWPASGAASITLEVVTGTDGTVLFDTARLTRRSGVACADAGAALDGVVEAAASVHGGGCVSGFASDGSLAVWLLDPESGLFFPGGAPSLPAGLLAPAVALDGAQLVGVAPRADGSLVLLSGVDCGTWSALGDPFAVDPTTLPPPEPSGPAPGIPGYGLAYAVVRRADGQSHHEIAIAAHQLDRRGISFATSTSGAPGTFTIGDFRSLDTIIDPETELWRSQVSVTAIGDDHVYLAGRREWTAPGRHDEVVHVYVDAQGSSLAGSDGLVEVARARLGPSGVDGALDADDGVAAAVLVETPPPPSSFRAVVLVRPSVPGTVTDFATLTISPGTACLNPTPEICNGIDDDCDGIVDDGSLCGGVVSGAFLGGSCGYVRVGDATHPIDAARFGCVESYEPSDAGTRPTSCDPAYPCRFETPATGCDPGSDCSFVTCAERGC